MTTLAAASPGLKERVPAVSVQEAANAQGSRFVLTLSCPQRPGIIHAVTTFLLEHGFSIDEHKQFDDHVSGTLFLRTAFSGVTGQTPAALAERFQSVADTLSMK